MKHETLTPEQDARMSRINHLGVPIVNANDPLIPHEHPFFKERDWRDEIPASAVHVLTPKEAKAKHGYELRSETRRLKFEQSLLDAV